GAWSEPAELDRQLALNRRHAVSGSLRQEAYAATERRPEEEAPSVLTLLGPATPTPEQTREMPAVPARERATTARGRAAVPAY
ncbi:hypothetical protein AB0I76_30390, partial [Micromonospora sp. NPDC049799]